MAIKVARFADLVAADGGMMDTVVTRELEKMAKDCEGRQFDNRPRKMTLTIEMKPVVKDGVAGFADIDWRTQFTPPPQRVEGTRLRIAPGKGLLINPESADDPNQHTIDELTGEVTKKPSA